MYTGTSPKTLQPNTSLTFSMLVKLAESIEGTAMNKDTLFIMNKI